MMLFVYLACIVASLAILHNYVFGKTPPASYEDLHIIDGILSGITDNYIYSVPSVREEDVGKLEYLTKLSKEDFIVQGEKGAFRYSKNSLARLDDGVLLGYLNGQVALFDPAERCIMLLDNGDTRRCWDDVCLEISRFTHALTLFPRDKDMRSSILLFSLSEDKKNLSASTIIWRGLFGICALDIELDYAKALVKLALRERIELWSNPHIRNSQRWTFAVQNDEYIVPHLRDIQLGYSGNTRFVMPNVLEIRAIGSAAKSS